MFERSTSTIALFALVALVAGCGSPASPTSSGVGVTPVPPTATVAPTTVVGETWTRAYGGSRNTVVGAILPTDDGGYFIVGTTDLEFEPEMRGVVYLVRTDAAGEVIWTKTYGGAGFLGGQGIAWADDGNLLVVGVAATDDTQGMDAYLLKIDPDGAELWSRTYDGPLDEYIGAIAQTPDGGYVLGGNTVDPNDHIADPGAAGYGGFEGRSNLYLLKVDADGDELWSRVYESRDNILASGGVLTPDGSFLVLATVTHFPDPDDDILLMKLDGNGDEVWSHTWKEDRCNPYGLIETADGNYLITASYAPAGPEDAKEDFLFVKVDPEGNEIWRSTFGDPDSIDYGVVLAQTADGGYVAAGERTPDRQTWEADIVLIKIDKDGKLVWERTRTASHTMLSTLLQHPDGGFVIAGAMFQGSAFNIVLTKTDSEGKVAE